MSIKENFLQLIKKVAGDSCLLEFVETRMQKFGNYVNEVYMMEYSLPILYARYEGEELQDKVMALDIRRKIAHDSAIAAIAQLNRLSVQLQTEPLFSGDVTDRYQVADFCEAVVSSFFQGRKHDMTHLVEEIMSEGGICE